jgi:hypothetical protein
MKTYKILITAHDGTDTASHTYGTRDNAEAAHTRLKEFLSVGDSMRLIESMETTLEVFKRLDQ